MTHDEQKEMILSAWREVFPESFASAGAVLRSVYFKGALGRDKSEFTNGILDNDPLTYYGGFYGDTFMEDIATLTVRPAEGSRYYCDAVKMRRVTIRNVTQEKLVARFKKLREFIISHRAEVMPGPFDLNKKLGVKP